MDTSKQQLILDLTDKILTRALERVSRDGLFTDVEDIDGKGGVKTQRLSNVTGLGEIRLIRSTVRKELGLDIPNQTGTTTNSNTFGTSPLLTLIQSGKIDLDSIHKLGTDDAQ